jgi:hypothetical protein
VLGFSFDAFGLLYFFGLLACYIIAISNETENVVVIAYFYPDEIFDSSGFATIAKRKYISPICLL